MIDLVAIEERGETARREVNRVCQKGKWTMSVPVREDDSDIILTNSFRDIPILVNEVKRLREELERQQLSGTAAYVEMEAELRTDELRDEVE